MLLERPNVGTNLKLRKVNLPKEMSVELAELVGIQFGDGNLYKNKKYNYILTYCFNSKEKWLHNHTTNIFLKQFGHKLKKSNKRFSNFLKYTFKNNLLLFS